MKLSITDIVQATKGNLIGSDKPCIENISTDSREFIKNSLFVPIIGEVYDGHQFMEDAYNNGYRVFLCDINHDFKKDDITLIKVKDTTKAFGDMARYIREKYDISFNGVTGSVGKTTTKDMIYNVLSQKYKTLKNLGNFNNNIGVPKTLFNLNSSYEKAVIEMGMSFKGEILELASIVLPHIAVISNIGMSHIENFPNQDGIFKAKMEIATYLKKDDILIVNGDDKYLATLKDTKHDYKLLTYGFDSSNDIYAYDIKMEDNGSFFKVKIDGKEEEFFVNAMARHNVLNALAAILVGLNNDMEISLIKEGLKNLSLTKGRLTVIKKKDFIMIDDSYNASKDSMISAIEVLKSYKNYKVLVLGDILEVGKYEEELHREVGKNIDNSIDLLVTVGKSSKYIVEEAMLKGFTNKHLHFKNYQELIDNLKKIIKSDIVILFKASHGIHLDLVVEYINKNYED